MISNWYAASGARHLYRDGAAPEEHRTAIILGNGQAALECEQQLASPKLSTC